MAAYHRVYDSRHLHADCQELGSAPEPYARQSSMVMVMVNVNLYSAIVTKVSNALSMGYLYLF